MSDTFANTNNLNNLREFLLGRGVGDLPLEEKLKRWAEPPGKTEEEKINRAVRMVREAISEDEKLSKLSIKVFAKGSFHNRTNIPSDSDVDVGVLATSYYLNDYPDGMTMSDFNFVSSSYTYEELKKDVASAIVRKIGAENVTVGKKAITVHANTVRVDADVVPHMVHRYYARSGTYVEGVALKDASGQLIRNWPEQDYDNGVAKNERTGKRYKALVRILKNLRGDMASNGIAEAESVPSYLLACLAWNVPDATLDTVLYADMVENSLAFLENKTSSILNVQEWGEVNELKYLFRDSQPWKLDGVHAFLKRARVYFRGMRS